MTNKEIIFSNRVFLMEQGVIEGIPGTTITWKDEFGERELMMPEEIRTIDEWNRMGFKVKKGEHAVAKFPIWHPNKKKRKKEEEKDEQEKEEVKGFFMRVSIFFTAGQVEPRKDK